MMDSKLGEFLANLKGKQILIVGLGIQGGGLGVARFMLRHGAKITVFDDKPSGDLEASIKALSDEEGVEYLFGGRAPNDIRHFAMVLKGPSVKWDHPLIISALHEGVYVTMETALFMKYKCCRTIGVTGTRGKSTTVNMIYNTLSEFYKLGHVYAAGNIPGTCALDLLDKVKQEDIVVLELSSWQLSGFHREKLSPEIAAITTLYEDHMNYYKNVEEYVFDKTAIYAYQKASDHIVISSNFASDYFKITKPNHDNIVKVGEGNFALALFHLRGLHNVLNASIAKAVCEKILDKVDTPTLEKTISSIKHLPCRQEFIATYKNVEIINDSASTTPSSVIAAIQAFADKEIVLILGGNAKNLSVTELGNVLIEKKDQIKCIVLLKGTFTEQILPMLTFQNGPHLVGTLSSFDEAVNVGLSKAIGNKRPTYLLFSPGATSFAQFKNEFHRGSEFVRIVSDIMSK